MAIVNETFYNNTYFGEPVATADFPRFDARAESLIAKITYGHATELNFPNLHDFQQIAVKEAICAQIEYYAYYGIELASAGRQSAGFTVGKVSVNDGGKIPLGKSSTVCPAAFSALEQTGLLNPQVNTLGQSVFPFWFWGWQ